MLEIHCFSQLSLHYRRQCLTFFQSQQMLKRWVDCKPDGSDQKPAQSTCLKFAGPRSRIVGHLIMTFLFLTNTAHQSKKKQTETIEHWSLYCIMGRSVFSCI